MEEGKGNVVDDKDIVYYKHETRFDSGSLVDLAEKRKVVEKFDMANPQYHEFIR